MIKNKIEKIIILAIVSLVISSCGTKMVLVKKHYSKGYFIAFNLPHSSSHSSKNKMFSQKEEPLLLTQKKELIKTSDNNELVVVPKKIFVFKNREKQKYPNKLIASTNKLVHSIDFIPKEIISPQKTGQTIASSSDEGLSLFWVVILILVILWALGLISGGFGLGILINLLLLVALILLILWLLRIV